MRRRGKKGRRETAAGRAVTVFSRQVARLLAVEVIAKGRGRKVVITASFLTKKTIGRPVRPMLPVVVAVDVVRLLPVKGWSTPSSTAKGGGAEKATEISSSLRFSTSAIAAIRQAMQACGNGRHGETAETEKAVPGRGRTAGEALGLIRRAMRVVSQSGRPRKGRAFCRNRGAVITLGRRSLQRGSRLSLTTAVLTGLRCPQSPTSRQNRVCRPSRCGTAGGEEQTSRSALSRAGGR